jgi:hypothetical protein
MKVLLSSAIAVAVAAAAIAVWVSAQSQTDRPPGVDEDNWIALSPDAGIVLVDFNGVPQAGAFSSGIPRELARLPEGTGVLMVRVSGLWTRVEWAAAPPRMRPLH